MLLLPALYLKEKIAFSGWHSEFSDENVQKADCVKGKCKLCVSKMGKTGTIFCQEDLKK